MRYFGHRDSVAGDLALLRLGQGAEGGALGEHLAHFLARQIERLLAGGSGRWLWPS